MFSGTSIRYRQSAIGWWGGGRGGHRGGLNMDPYEERGCNSMPSTTSVYSVLHRIVFHSTQWNIQRTPQLPLVLSHSEKHHVYHTENRLTSLLLKLDTNYCLLNSPQPSWTDKMAQIWLLSDNIPDLSTQFSAKNYNILDIKSII